MKALIIHNPTAGDTAKEQELQPIADLLTQRGHEVTAIEATHGPGDATTYARKAAVQGHDIVFVVGGDGTLAQTVDGLVGTETALAVLPGGSGNVFARQLNLPVPGGLHPHPLLESARLLLEGQIRSVDVGRVSTRQGSGPTYHFLCWAGVGFDAQINRVVSEDTQLRKRLGIGAFFLAAGPILRDLRGMPAIVRMDGHRVSRRMIMLVANNIQLYGIVFRMAQRAVLDDGLLDLYCFQGSGAARAVLHAVRLLFSQHTHDPHVDIFRARHIEVMPRRPLPVHVDGDYIGNTPAVIEVVPRALRLLVPRCAPSSLFVDGTGMLPPETTWEWMMRMAREAQTAIKERSGLT